MPPTDHAMTFTDDEDRDSKWDDYVLGALLLGLGGLRVVIAFAQHEPFETEATLAVIAMLLGALVLLSAVLRRAAP